MRAESSFWSIARSQVIAPLAPHWVRRVWRALRQLDSSVSPAARIMNRRFAKRVRIAGYRPTPLDKLETRDSQRLHHLRVLSGLIPLSLEIADRAARAFSIEPRYPFFDQRLIEFCLAVPPEQKLSDGWTRSIMRRALATALPAEVAWRRTKSDLSAAFTRGLLRFERAEIDRVVIRGNVPVGDYVNLRKVQAIYARCNDAGSAGYALTIWKVLTLNRWLERMYLTQSDAGYGASQLRG
jgi:asparagine synthase (glutamine-hydrolysing)